MRTEKSIEKTPLQKDPYPPFSASPQKIRPKTYGRSPDLQRLGIVIQRIPAPFLPILHSERGRAFLRLRRQWGNSIARFPSSLLNPPRKGDTVRPYSVVLLYYNISPKKSNKKTALPPFFTRLIIRHTIRCEADGGSLRIPSCRRPNPVLRANR